MRLRERKGILDGVEAMAIDAAKLDLIRTVIDADAAMVARIEDAIAGKHPTTVEKVDLSKITIDETDLSPQLKRSARTRGMKTLADLAKTADELRELRFQDGSIEKIRAELAKHGHKPE